MPVVIRKRSVLLDQTPAVKPLVEQPDLEVSSSKVVTPSEPIIQPKRVESGVPRGRNYLRSRKTFEKPKKTLEQILPKVYNTPESKRDFEDSSLEYYSPYRCVDCKDTKKIMVYDSCEFCDGAGCRKCNNTGEVKSYIPCQLCNTKKHNV